MILNSKHRGYLFGENGMGLSPLDTSLKRGSAHCFHVKNTYIQAEDGAIRKNSKTGVMTPVGQPACGLLRIFKLSVNTEFFTAESQSRNFAARLEKLENRQDMIPGSVLLLYINKV